MAGCGRDSRVSRYFRLAVGMGLAATTLTASVSSAEAYYRHHARHFRYVRHAAPAYDPAFSAIVVDANTGRELYGVNETGLRHPASITKVMTLYLLFEKLDKGELTLQSRIPVSEHAAAQEPSKLGIPAGETISVEDAIKAVVTRSANDIAVAIAEDIGGDESSFAAMMTRKAHSLGMSRTIYRNASGLPNDEQITCARDLTILARALQERYPKYFRYFSTHEFVYDGQVIGNHNHLLGRVEGVDGIKTGYTRASGFNLLTSVHRDGRALVAVVMGGRSAAARDHTMEALIDDHIAEASNHGHSATMIAENETPVSALPPPRPMGVVASANVAPRNAAMDGEGDNSAEDEESDAPAAKVVKASATVAAPAAAPVPPAPIQSAAFAPAPKLTVRVATDAPLKAPEPARVEKDAKIEKSPRDLGWMKGPEPVKTSSVAVASAKPHEDARKPEPRHEETRVARADESSEAAPTPKGGWIVQIGATDDAGKANDLLIRAKAQNRALASAKPFTEKFKKGEDTFYRARFAGLDSAAAEQVCRSLKRSGFACFAAKLD